MAAPQVPRDGCRRSKRAHPHGGACPGKDILAPATMWTRRCEKRRRRGRTNTGWFRARAPPSGVESTETEAGGGCRGSGRGAFTGTESVLQGENVLTMGGGEGRTPT